jgi:GNAT superfamily N-acetyltransferase
MTNSVLKHRLATRADLSGLATLMDAAISELQRPFLDVAQIESSRAIMGLDTQLIDDGTYFVVEQNSAVAGRGGWSRRANVERRDRSPGRDAALLAPSKDPARVRAMYTHPDFTRRGVGRLMLALCEEAARDEGLSRVELMATMAGEPLYRLCGYQPIEPVLDDRGSAQFRFYACSRRLISRVSVISLTSTEGVANDYQNLPWYRVSREGAHLAGQSRTVVDPVAEVTIGTDRILSGQTNERERQPHLLHGYGLGQR